MAIIEVLGDYEYEVVKEESGKVKCFRTLLNASVDTRRRRRVPLREIPSKSLKDIFASLTGKTLAELET